MVLLREFHYHPPRDISKFPLNLPFLRNLKSLNFSSVTILVGENGAGKSTLLEGIATQVNLPSLGEYPLAQDPSLQHARSLNTHCKLIWDRRTHKGFFLRTEDYFAYIKQIELERENNLKELARVKKSYQHHSQLAQMKARSPYTGTISEINAQFGSNADGCSHGESYLALFRQRLNPDGLYIIDEAEAALSPVSQLALIRMIVDTVNQGGQFVLATHSPILMAIPKADIYLCDEQGLHPIEYDEIDHVQFYRDFLANPDLYLHHLLSN